MRAAHELQQKGAKKGSSNKPKAQSAPAKKDKKDGPQPDAPPESEISFFSASCHCIRSGVHLSHSPFPGHIAEQVLRFRNRRLIVDGTVDTASDSMMLANFLAAAKKVNAPKVVEDPSKKKPQVFILSAISHRNFVTCSVRSNCRRRSRRQLLLLVKGKLASRTPMRPSPGPSSLSTSLSQAATLGTGRPRPHPYRNASQPR